MRDADCPAPGLNDASRGAESPAAGGLGTARPASTRPPVSRRIRRSVLHAGLVAALTAAAACAPRDTRFRVVAFKNTGTEEQYEQAFADGTFGIDNQNRFSVAFERDDSETGDATSNQLLLLRVFWRPLPGITYAEETQTNAHIIYCLHRGPDVITYEGAGFVYFTLSRDGLTMRGRIESSSLVPARVSGQPEDYFGPCHLTGRFTAESDQRRTADAHRSLRQRVGPPVGSTAAAGATR